MIRRNAKLRVWVNPYSQLDGYGRPAGAVPMDPTHERGGLVGAKLVKDPEAAVEELPRGDARTAEPGLMYAFDNGTIELPVTQYYLQRLGRGELFPADAWTASQAGVEFVAQDKAIAAAKAKAAANFFACYGELPPELAGEKG